MPVVTLDADRIRQLLGRDVPTEELATQMPMMGGDLDGIDKERITIEWFPDRPDLLPIEGTARALRAFLGIAPGMPKHEVAPARTHLEIDASVAAVRPYAALCFVRGIAGGEGFVEETVQAQEKLAVGPGRRRRKVAIGVHDARDVRGPFRYAAVGGDAVRFVPLGGSEPMAPAEIVRRHPKGQEYGHLLEGSYPVFCDGDGEVLSMPPVINAARTAVHAETTDVLIDVTGTDQAAVRRTIALLAAGMAERGGTIEAVEVRDASGTWSCPDLRPVEHVLHADDVESLLGITLSGDDVARCLRRMGHDAEAFGNRVLVQSPPWRFDLMHPVDWLEDVAIGHGFAAFPGSLPARGTFGKALPRQDTEDRLRTALCGLGFLENRALTLTAPGREAPLGAAPAVRLLNPVLEDQTHVRSVLLPGLLSVFAANRHRSLPQRLWELGHVVEPATWRNRLRLAVAETGARVGFAEAKGLAEAVLREAGWSAEHVDADVPGYIPGRAVRLTVDGRTVGHYGELHPDTLIAAGLGAATVALELDVEAFP